MTLQTYAFLFFLFGCMATVLIQIRLFYKRTYVSGIVAAVILALAAIVTSVTAAVDPVAVFPSGGYDRTMLWVTILLGGIFIALGAAPIWRNTEQKFFSDTIPFPTCIACAIAATIAYPIATWFFFQI